MNEPSGKSDSSGDSSWQDSNMSYTDSMFGPSSFIPSPTERYEIREPVGKGGQGCVYLGEDKTLGRTVAIKEANQVTGWSRLQREALIAASLSHPNIVPVYDLTTRNGTPVSVMKLIGKETLADAIDSYHKQKSNVYQVNEIDPSSGSSAANGRTYSLFDMLRILNDSCNAISYAHSKGILHRDLKPRNISLGDYGETIVLDWGLACSIHDIQASNLPHRSCSPDYAAPEQMQGISSQIGYATDIYSLGAILFHVLTNTTVTKAGSKAKYHDSLSPRLLVRDVPPDLDAICIKALQTKPENRYGSAAEFAADLLRFKQDLAVSVRKPVLSDSIRRFSKKYYAGLLSTATAAILLSLAACSLAVLTWYKDAKIAAAQQDTTTALAVADNTLRSLEDRGVSYYILADAATGRLRANEAKSLPTAALPLYKGIELLRQKSPAEAIPALIESTQQDPTRGLACFFLSLAYADIDDYSQAIVVGKKLVELKPDNVYAQQHLADILLGHGLKISSIEEQAEIFKQAEAYARRACAIDPNYSPAVSTLGQILVETGQQAEAIVVLEKAMALEPSPENKRHYVNLLRDQKRYVDALKLSQELIVEEPEYRHNFLLHARNLLDLAELEQAIENFRKFDEMQKSLPNLRSPVTSHFNDWGVALIGLRRFDEALQIFKRAERDFAGNPVFENNVSLALLGAGQTEECISKLRNIIEESKQPNSLCLLLQALIVSGELSQAQEIESSFPPFSENSNDKLVFIRAGLAQILADSTNSPSSSSALNWPSLSKAQPLQKEIWDYYFLQQWSEKLPDIQKAQVKKILEKLSTIVSPAYTKS